MAAAQQRADVCTPNVARLIQRYEQRTDALSRTYWRGYSTGVQAVQADMAERIAAARGEGYHAGERYGYKHGACWGAIGVVVLGALLLALFGRAGLAVGRMAEPKPARQHYQFPKPPPEPMAAASPQRGAA